VAASSAQRWAPHVTVATIVVRDGRLLLVEERIDGRDVLNQPAGHLEPGESLLQAAVRETLEETGWDVTPTGLVGVYQWKAPDGTDFLRFTFTADALAHHPGRPLDAGIMRALWLSPSELEQRRADLRSPLVWQGVADHLAGHRLPLSALKEIA